MIDLVIWGINQHIKKIFEKYPDTKIYGLTQPVIRVQGTEKDLLPCTVDKNGEGTYVGIDDEAPFILYHKNISVITRLVSGSSIGDEAFDISDTFNNQLIIYLDRKKVNPMPDDLVFYIQSNFPNKAEIPDSGIKQIRILFQGVLLNSAQVYDQEYGPGAKGLDPSKSMLAINYGIEATFKRNCFSDCVF